MALGRVPGLILMPLGGGHSLVSLSEGTTLTSVELRLRDMLERDAGPKAADHAVIRSIVGTLRDIRHSRTAAVLLSSLLVVGRASQP